MAENSKNQNDLEVSIIDTEKSLSTGRGDTNQPAVEIKKDDPGIEVLEETCTSFVVEDTGVIHIKKERISRRKKSSGKKTEKFAQDGTETGSGDMDTREDIKNEDSILEKNESTIADVYLQLDVTDNLDTYLERERARKLNLSKKLGLDERVNETTSEIDKDASSVSEAPSFDNNSAKRSKKSSSKNENESKDDSTKSVKSEPCDVGMRNTDVLKEPANNPLKSEQSETDKKDSRFIWVSNICKTTKATTLKMHLSTHGKVQMTKIVTDGKECFGYAVFESHEDVVNCIKHLQNSELENCQIVLSDKIPDKKLNDSSKDKDGDKKKSESKVQDRKDAKSIKSDCSKKKPKDPLTLKVEDLKIRKKYSEERRKAEDLERRRQRERLSMERREIERRRREIEREREREREREKEIRRRERMEEEERRKLELKLEKERKKLQYERQLIEKEKLELLRFKRKLLSKEKEENTRESHSEQKKRRSVDEYERKKFSRMDEAGSKHEPSEQYWKNDSIANIKSKPVPYDAYKKGNQDVCVAPPPPVLSNNYHATSERSRLSERDRQWSDRKEYESRQKSYVRKIEDNRGFGVQNEHRQAYAERSFSKEYKHKDYEAIPNQNYGWDGYSDQSYKGQNIPVIRSEPVRSMQRHQNFQAQQFGAPMQDYYPGSNYRRNDYFGRSTERKY